MRVSHSNCDLESITACKVLLKNTSDLKAGEIKALFHCNGNANSHANVLRYSNLLAVYYFIMESYPDLIITLSGLLKLIHCYCTKQLSSIIQHADLCVCVCVCMGTHVHVFADSSVLSWRAIVVLEFNNHP